MDFETVDTINVPKHRIIMAVHGTNSPKNCFEEVVEDFRSVAFRNHVLIDTAALGDCYDVVIRLIVSGSYPKVYQFLKGLHRKYDLTVEVLEPLV